MINNDKEREAFEVAYRETYKHRGDKENDFYLRRNSSHPEKYYELCAVHGWELWQLARAKQHSGEAVAYADVRFNQSKKWPPSITLHFVGGNGFGDLGEMGHGLHNLYLSPQQPQGQDQLFKKAVADALEKEAKICDDKIVHKDLYHELNVHNEMLEDCAKEIRNLINQPTQKGIIKMSKAEILELLKLLSALESWIISNNHRLPDYLFERLDNAINVITEKVLSHE